MDDTSKIKYPGRSGKLNDTLSRVPRDGQPHRIATMAFTVAEQTARGYNVLGGEWQFGYTHETDQDTGKLVSVLWARHNG